MKKKEKFKRTSANTVNKQLDDRGGKTVVHEEPLSRKKQLYITLGTIVIAYLLVFLGRYTLLSWWNNPFMIHCGGPAMITNDTYFWFAGAEGVGRSVTESFAIMTKFIRDVSGVSLCVLGIWLPVIMVPLIAIPTCWFFALLGYPYAGAVASIFMCNVGSFFGRTVPGYYDNDMLDLFFPIAFGATLFWLFSSMIRKTWWRQSITKDVNSADKKLSYYWAIATIAGLIAVSYTWLYEVRNVINFAMLFTMASIAWFLLKGKEQRQKFCGAVAIVGLFTAVGWYGIPIAIIAICVAHFKPEDCEKRKIGYYLLCGFGLLYVFSGEFTHIATVMFNKFSFFFAGGGTGASTLNKLPVPSFSVSVSEIQRVPFDAFVEMTGFNMPLFFAGTLGFLLLLLLHPATVSFLPIFVLGMSSVFLGVRFSIFTSTMVGIGFAFLLAEITRRVFAKLHLRLIVFALVTLLFFSFTFKKEIGFPTILSKEYAEGLCQLKGKIAKDSQFWAWWDWGHPIAFYTHGLPFADGGINELRSFIVAVVHTANTTETAAEIIKYTVVSQKIAEKYGKDDPNTEFQKRYRATGYSMFEPTVPIHDLRNPQKMRMMLNKVMATEKGTIKIPSQYLAFTWDNVKFFHWIGYFGKWDTKLKRSNPPNIGKLPQGTYTFDQTKGIITVGNNRIALSSVDIITATGLKRATWPSNKEGHNLIKNDVTGDLYIADDFVHNSLMYRMLVEDPKLFSKDFELVVDRFPWARVYKLRT